MEKKGETAAVAAQTTHSLTNELANTMGGLDTIGYYFVRIWLRARLEKYSLNGVLYYSTNTYYTKQLWLYRNIIIILSFL